MQILVEDLQGWGPYSILLAVKQFARAAAQTIACPKGALCPLSSIRAGQVVCVKQLTAAPDVTCRLRELGLREDQHIRLVARQSSFICQICNARLAISSQLADSILVEAQVVQSADI
jgi:Fe2+ transport system protein FeoA